MVAREALNLVGQGSMPCSPAMKTYKDTLAGQCEEVNKAFQELWREIVKALRSLLG